MNEVIDGFSVKEALNDYADTMSSMLDLLLPASRGVEGRLYDAMRYATLGQGKFIRPYILRASALVFEVEEQYYLRAGAAVDGDDR